MTHPRMRILKIVARMKATMVRVCLLENESAHTCEDFVKCAYEESRIAVSLQLVWQLKELLGERSEAEN